MDTKETHSKDPGYLAKGAVYVLAAVAAMLYAWNPQAGNSPVALGLVGLIAVGLAVYGLWRLADAIRNPEGRGPAHRLRFALSGLANAAVAAGLLNLLLGSLAGGGETVQGLTSWLTGDVDGRGLMAVVGLGTALMGLLQFYQVFSARFMRRLDTDGMQPQELWFTKRTGQWGYAARGVAFAILGVLLLALGWNAGGGLPPQVYGSWLIALLAASLATYGMSQWVQAGHRGAAAIALLIGLGGLAGSQLPASKVASGGAAGKRKVQLASAAPTLPQSESRLASSFVPPPRETLPIPFVPPVLEPLPDQPAPSIAEPGGDVGYADVREIIRVEAEKQGIDPLFVECIVRQESNFDPNATSYVGAMGLMQLMPETAADLGVEDPYDPAQNVAGGVRYIADLLAAYGGDHQMALAAYNAGPGNVEHYGGIPPFEETQNYVARIYADYQSRLGQA